MGRRIKELIAQIRDVFLSREIRLLAVVYIVKKLFDLFLLRAIKYANILLRMIHQ